VCCFFLSWIFCFYSYFSFLSLLLIYCVSLILIFFIYFLLSMSFFWWTLFCQHGQWFHMLGSFVIMTPINRTLAFLEIK
jgi:hypothetical protein